MYRGIGIDLIEIARVEEALRRHRRFPERIFTPNEVAYCLSRGNPAASLAARFAAKEAVRKACSLADGRVQMPWRDIEIRSCGGKPEVRFLNSTAELIRERGIAQVLISLSHTRNCACAVAMALGAASGEDTGQLQPF